VGPGHARIGATRMCKRCEVIVASKLVS
jgi:hypothetical protein